MDESKCEAFKNPSRYNLTVSLVLTIGIVFSYIPQHVRVVKRRSSEGISPWFLLLGVLSAICAVSNILLLGGPIYHCCTVISGGECFASSLGIAQITLQAISASMILVLVLIFARNQPFQPPEDYYRMKLVGKYSFVFAVMALLVSIIAYYEKPQYIQVVANSFGVAGAVLAVIQYFPQIYTTATLQHAGTLSIPMMCIQTPGGFIWSMSLASRPGASWSSWIPYLTAATLQGILLAMAVFYETRAKARAARIQSQEHTPLLS